MQPSWSERALTRRQWQRMAQQNILARGKRTKESIISVVQKGSLQFLGERAEDKGVQGGCG